jgi:hypothetical protein
LALRIARSSFSEHARRRFNILAAFGVPASASAVLVVTWFTRRSPTVSSFEAGVRRFILFSQRAFGGFNDRRAASPAPALAYAEAGGRWLENMADDATAT